MCVFFFFFFIFLLVLYIFDFVINCIWAQFLLFLFCFVYVWNIAERFFHCSQCSDLQPAVFAFHDNHGTSIVLSDNQRTAERTGGKGSSDYGIVMSRDPMRVNHLYEVNSDRENDTQ